MANHEKTLFVTDADLPVQVYIYVWVSERKELVVEYIFEDDRSSCRNFKRVAVVDREDTMMVAKFHNVKVEELPQIIHAECRVDYESTPLHADAIFQDTLDFILDSGAKYRLKETI